MINKKAKFVLYSPLFLFSSFCWADSNSQERHPFYLGAIGGYGSSTWKGLVATKRNQSVALMLSTPIDAKEGGAAWGLLGGYEFTPNFAIETSYMKYSDATIYFNKMSLFSFTHDGISHFSSKTETLGFMGKLMVPIPNQPKLRIFSSAGAAGVHRKDIIVNDWRVGPTFSVGVNYSFTERLMGEVAGNYTAGYGESQLSPVDSYYPFLYSVAVHLVYRI